MSVRALFVALLILASSPAGAQWHAVAMPPGSGLPAVTVDFGYPGPYIPQLNAPITLHATASSPFDGYIGYHFAANGRSTLDTPVIARANISPAAPWSFSTFATLRDCCGQETSLPRELAIEWRDRNMHLLGVRSTGVPPWTKWTDEMQPLRVASAPGLSTRAQWYTGFSSIVVPLAMWIDLPQPERDAMFRSGVPIFFVGFPRPDQRLGHLEQVLLPVTFAPGSSTYEAPWPYPRETKTAPVSWTAKPGARHVGQARNPYIADSASVWVADDAALARPLPSMIAYGNRRYVIFNVLGTDSGGLPDDIKRDFSLTGRRAGFIAEHAGATTASIAAVLAIAAWLLLRKTPRIAIAIATLLTATILFAARDAIRPAAGDLHYDFAAPIAPGIREHVHIRRTYGEAPLAPLALERDAVTGDIASLKNAEVRTSATPPSFGQLASWREWDGATRWSYRRELDSTAAPRSVMLRSLVDDHMPIAFSLLDPPASSSQFRISCRLKPQTDGRGMCSIALPETNALKAEGEVVYLSPYPVEAVEVTWETGTTRLALTRKHRDISLRSAPLPPVALHGIIEVAVPRFDPHNTAVFVEVGERR